MLSLLGVVLLLGCEADKQTSEPACAQNEVWSGNSCIQDPSQPQTDLAQQMPANDAGILDAASQAVNMLEVLLLVVDDWFPPSGYMGDGEFGGITRAPCETPVEDSVGTCHGFTWTPGDVGWGGVFWLHSDMN